MHPDSNLFVLEYKLNKLQLINVYVMCNAKQRFLKKSMYFIIDKTFRHKFCNNNACKFRKRAFLQQL